MALINPIGALLTDPMAAVQTPMGIVVLGLLLLTITLLGDWEWM